MATKIIEVDLSKPVQTVSDFENYHSVYFLIKWKDSHLGFKILHVIEGSLSTANLYSVLFSSLSENNRAIVLSQSLISEVKEANSYNLPKATIAICTRERADYLKKCLEGIFKQGEYGQEVLVIDNAPITESTKKVVDRYPEIKYFIEPKKGLNNARNKAIKEASNEIIVFIDDDAFPKPNWLYNILLNFDSHIIKCVTGLTVPEELDSQAQQWHERYSSFIRGFEKRIYDVSNLSPSNSGQVGAGVNMAFRKDIFKEIGLFDPALDAGTVTGAGGDVEIFSRLIRTGYKICYEPKAVVSHTHRKTMKELTKMIYGNGKGVYAVWTRGLFIDKDISVFSVAIKWFIYNQFPNLIRSLFNKKKGLTIFYIWELVGCLAGPLSYIRSRYSLTKYSHE